MTAISGTSSTTARRTGRTASIALWAGQILAGAVGLLVPRLTGLAALCTVALMIGAVTVTVIFMGAALAVLPAVIGVLAALVAYGRRSSTVQLAGWVRTRR